MSKSLICTLVLCSGLLLPCHPFAQYNRSQRPSSPQSSQVVAEFGRELADMQQQLRQYDLDHELMVERMQKLESSIAKLKKELPDTLKADGELAKSKLQLSEKRLLNVEKTQEQLAEAAAQFHIETTTRLDAIDKTLAKLQQAMSVLVDAPLSCDSPSGATTYVVQSRDTLEKIARRYSISIDHLKRANQLTKDQIRVGQKLKIPEKAS